MHFSSQISGFCIYRELCILTNLRVLISNMARVCQTYSPKYQIKAFVLSDLKFSSFARTLHLENFKSADFTDDNNFFKFLPKNVQIKHFHCKIQEIFLT